MKAVILAGGFGTRLGEETVIRPKPMVEIGGRPILWHIMKIYSAHGINDFIICLGYKGWMIKEYFANYALHSADVTFDIRNNTIKVHRNQIEPWSITLVETGENAMTGGRLRQAKPYLNTDESFCFTYGDGLSNVNITQLIKQHCDDAVIATVTAVKPAGRFGVIELEANQVKCFREKPNEGGWINGGFFVLKPTVFDYIADNQTVWEQEPMENLARDNQMTAYFHHDFWQPMDTLREKILLENMWNNQAAPWKIWS